MKKLTRHICSYVLLILLGFGFTTSAAFAISEVEDNDTFATRQILPLDTTIVTGTLIEDFNPNIFDFNIVESLAAGGGDVDFFTINNTDIPGLTSGDPFIAWIDNTIGVGTPDTILGTFDELSTLINTDDDGSPIGNGVASGISGTVNPDSTIRSGVSGFPDFDFDGIFDGGFVPHNVTGDYEFFVRTGVSNFNDVDFFTFLGLQAGDPFTMEITSADFDSTLGWLDDFGAIIDEDDDGGVNLLSKISATVPASGSLNFVVSAYSDLSPFDGNYQGQFGTYTLALNPEPIPEPTTMALLGIGLAGLGGRYLKRRRKQRADA